MHITIITAMPEERAAVRAVLTAPVEKRRYAGYPACLGRLAGHTILIIESGMGFENAGRAAEAIIGAAVPDLLISAGFCGGLAPELRVGDVVVATALLVATVGDLENVPTDVPDACRKLVDASTPDDRLFSGSFISTPRMLPKRRLAGMVPPSVRCPAVEMESAAIAQIAARHRVPFAAIRSVSDPLEEELDFSLEEFCNRDMKISIPRVLLAVLRTPRIIPQLIRLASNSRVAAKRLGSAIERLVAAV